MRPESEADLARIIRLARAPLSPVGGGTRLRPGEGQGARLDLTGLSGIQLYEPAALTIVVQAATPLAEVQALLAAEQQMLAFEPDARDGSTIGGVVAANASGPRRVQAGACRDALLGVRFVDGQGEVIRNGGRVMKNVTGYDLVKLMAGSRGELGVLTEVALKTAPRPPVALTLALPGLDAAQAVPALTAALGGPFDVSGAGWLPERGAVIRLEGLAGSVQIRHRLLSDRLSRFGAVVEVDAKVDGAADAQVDGAADGAVWSRLTPRAAKGDLWRIICLPSEAPLLLSALPQPLSVDWGGALIWMSLPPGSVPNLPAWSGHASRVSGTAALTLPAPHPLVARLNASLRDRFDPRAIFASESPCRPNLQMSS